VHPGHGNLELAGDTVDHGVEQRWFDNHDHCPGMLASLSLRIDPVPPARAVRGPAPGWTTTQATDWRHTMSTFRVSGTALPSTITGDVSPVDEAVAGEEGVEVETATRLESGELQFTLHVQAADAGEAEEIGRRVGDRLSGGSSVTVLGEV
jgi:hypothetical protein